MVSWCRAGAAVSVHLHLWAPALSCMLASTLFAMLIALWCLDVIMKMAGLQYRPPADNPPNPIFVSGSPTCQGGADLQLRPATSQPPLTTIWVQTEKWVFQYHKVPNYRTLIKYTGHTETTSRSKAIISSISAFRLATPSPRSPVSHRNLPKAYTDILKCTYYFN